ncbi:MAG: type II toxin-antitoxin system RelE/ParE family toxin [Chloroflexota bacterium]
MARLVWTRRALEHLREVRAYVARDSPRAAAALTTRIARATRRLEQFPLSGRVVPEEQDSTFRELLVLNYRIIYQVRSRDVVEILMVWHGMRRLPRLHDA